MDKKILFYGGGNMAKSIMGGLFKNSKISPKNVTVNVRSSESCDQLRKTYGVTALIDGSQAIKEADMIIIAVNPHQVSNITKQLKEGINEKTIVMSIAAGVEIATLESQLGSDKKIVRMMPNTLSQSANGYSAACLNKNIDENDKEFITKFLDALGQTLYISEDMFSTFTAFSCSGPLWIYKTVESLIDAGVYVGFSRAEARGIVIKNMLGAADILDSAVVHPAIKVDELTSPGGVTIEGLKVLEEKGFAASLIESVSKSVDRLKSIG